MCNLIAGRAYPFKSDASIKKNKNHMFCSTSPTMQHVNDDNTKRPRNFIYLCEDTERSGNIFVIPINTDGDETYYVKLPPGQRVCGWANAAQLWSVPKQVFIDYESSHSGAEPYQYSDFPNELETMIAMANTQIERLQPMCSFMS